MAEIAKWKGHVFQTTVDAVRGFRDLTIKGSAKTEDKTESSEGYVSRKNAEAAQVSMTAHLNAFLGCDVRAEAIAFVQEAQAGAKDYIYIGGKKLLPYQMMLTEANVDSIELTGRAEWVKADVKLTFRQASKSDGSNSSSSSSSSKTSSKASVKTTSAAKTVTSYTGKAAVAGAIAGVTKASTSSWTTSVINTIKNAKTVSVTKKVASSNVVKSVKMTK